MGTRRTASLLIMFIVVFGARVTRAQAPVDPGAAGGDSVATEGRLLAERSTLMEDGAPITLVSLTSADVADALVTASGQLLVHGKTPCTISMFVWSRGGVVQRYEIAVQRDVAKAAARVRDLFPQETIDVQSNGRS